MTDTLKAFALATAGAVIPALLGTILSNHRCILSEQGCETPYSCTSDSGHCSGASMSKRGQGLTWGVCVSRTGFTCTQVANQGCFEELYYTDAACSGAPCGSSQATTPSGCITS